MGKNCTATFIKNNFFIQQLHDIESPSEKFSILEKEVINYGFDGVLYTFIPKLLQLSNPLESVFQYSDTYQPRMLDYYKNQSYSDDFVIRLIKEGNTDCIHWWEQSQHQNLTQQEQHVNCLAREYFGINLGISIPTLSNDMGIAFVSIISFSKITSNKSLDIESLEYLKKCAQNYHDHVMTNPDLRYYFILPILKTLSPKKVVLIKYLISGKPINCISKHADISTRYAEKLLIEIRKQFGNITTNELIYLLGRLNIPEYI